MNRIIDFLGKKGDNLSNQTIPNLDELEYLEEFLHNYSINDCYSYENISNISFLGSLLRAKNIDLTFDETFKLLEICQDYINNIKYNTDIYSMYFDVLQDLYYHGVLIDIINYGKRRPKSVADAKFIKEDEDKQLYNEFLNLDELIFSEKDEDDNTISYDYNASNALLCLFHSLPDKSVFNSFLELEDIIHLIRKDIKDSLEEIKKTEKLPAGFNISKKELDKIIRSAVNDFIKEKKYNFFNNHNLISNYYSKLHAETRNFTKSTNKQIRRLEELDNLIKCEDRYPVLSIENISEKLLFDNDILVEYLVYILKHNLDEFENAEERNIQYQQNSINKLDILFSKYNFNFNDLDDSVKNILINKSNLKDLDSVLQLLRYSNISFVLEYEGLFDRILVNSTSNMIKFISQLIKSNILTEDFILLNPSIMYNVEDFNLLSKNINYLNNIGINLVNVSKYNSNIYLLQNSELANQTSMLEEYKVNLDNDNLYDFNMLEDSKILDILDNFIELGYGKTIINNPQYLKKNSGEIVKRIMISKLIGLSVVNSNGKLIGKIMNGNNFYVNKEDYNNYIIDYKEDYQNPICTKILENNSRNVISASIRNIPFIKKLDELYMKDSITYIINGVIISRKRVMRNLEALIKNIDNNDIEIKDLVFQAILFNMINNIEPDTLTKIYKSLSEISLEKDKSFKLIK